MSSGWFKMFPTNYSFRNLIYRGRLVFENTYFRLILLSIIVYWFYFLEINYDRHYANKWYEKACCDCGIKGWSWGFRNCMFSQSYRSFLHKIHKELEKVNDNVMSVSKCKKKTFHTFRFNEKTRIYSES